MDRPADAVRPASLRTAKARGGGGVSGKPTSTGEVLTPRTVAELPSGQGHPRRWEGACLCGWAGNWPAVAFVWVWQQERRAGVRSSPRFGSASAQHHPGGRARRRLTRVTRAREKEASITHSYAAGRRAV